MVAIKKRSDKACLNSVVIIRLLTFLAVVVYILSVYTSTQLRASINQVNNEDTTTITSKGNSALRTRLSESKRAQAAEKAPIPIFTPEKVLNGEVEDYLSLPVLDDDVTYEAIQARVKKAIDRKIDEPYGLMHQGNPPGHDVVMGLASYQDAMSVFRILVGSLRQTGFDGHIILGVHPQISQDEQDYLKKMDVTYYAVEIAECDKSIHDESDPNNLVRGKCAKGVQYLTLEKGRFEMSRQWLHACKECTGWALATDTRDIFFQAPPFSGMPPPDNSPYDLLFIEELAPYSQPDKPNKRPFIASISNGFYQGSQGGCYGQDFHKKYSDRATLCSGTIIGNRKGMDRFLAVFVDEFLQNNVKSNAICKASETPDQLVLQPIYYSGHFGDFDRTRTSPWGAGPVNTIGVPCVDSSDPKKPKYGSLDLTEFDTATGMILNPNLKDGHPARIAPMIHQYDRCYGWIDPFLEKHDLKLFGGMKTPLDQVISAPWLKGTSPKH